MKTILMLMVAGLVATPLQAQQVMDGRGKGDETAFAKLVAEALIGKTNGPYSAQLAKLKQKGDDVCGLVNLKGASGGYVGFRPFLFSQGQVFLDQTTPC
jgi:hypothetical protein